MLTLRVTSISGATPEHPIEARFDSAGGAIGRADDNRLVLPDPTRRISRLHARVVFVDGAFDLVEVGANPIEVNGSPLGPGQKARLQDGDRLRIGNYDLRVTLDRPMGAPAPRNELPTAFGGPLTADPLGLGSGAGVSPMQAAPKARGPGPGPGIPDDFDPFRGVDTAPPPAKAARLPDDLDLGLGSLAGPAPSIDEVFGLEAKPGADPLAGGPLAESGARRGIAAPAASVDPLAALGVPPAVAPAPVPDLVPEIRGTFRIPAARPEAAAGETFLSWEDGLPAGTDARREPATLPPQPAERQPAATDAAPPLQAAQPAPQTPPAPPAAPDELARAFAAGLGMDRQVLASLTPEAMQQVGRLLREAAQGTLDLLMMRALTKREVRAEATMIVSKDNNPLKFSPSVEGALAHLLAPQGHGFMPPVEAMRDAYDDLRSHQVGIMAGLRAALAGVLKRFDPAVLEQRLTHKSMLDNLLPIHRRARLWDLYEQLYRDIAREAEDDFHTLFGREFLRAYEEQVARLEDSRGDDAPTPPGARP